MLARAVGLRPSEPGHMADSEGRRSRGSWMFGSLVAAVRTLAASLKDTRTLESSEQRSGTT